MKKTLLSFSLLWLAACDTPVDVPPDRTPPPAPCPQAVVAGAPVAALRWASPLETYLRPGTPSGSIAIDYLVSPPAHVDQVSVEFDFDRVLDLEPMNVSGECVSSIPVSSFVAAVPDGAEDIVRATVIASSTSGNARTGRVFLSTGTGSLELRTDGLDAGDAAEGPWWALFEPAAGTSRLLILPAQLDRTTFLVEGLPEDQPGTLALIQTAALEQDPATGAIYAPWGFSSDWPRYARHWYGLTLTRAAEGLVTPNEILPAGIDAARAHTLDTALQSPGDYAYRVLPSGSSAVIEIACDATQVNLTVLTFTELSVAGAPRTYRAGETATVSGSCEAGAASWALRLAAQSLNGRNGAVMLNRATEIVP